MDDISDSLTAEERAKGEEELMAEVDKFVANQNTHTEPIDEEEDEQPKKKRKKPQSKGKPAPKKDLVFDVKMAVCNEVRKHPELYQINHKEY